MWKLLSPAQRELLHTDHKDYDWKWGGKNHIYAEVSTRLVDWLGHDCGESEHANLELECLESSVALFVASYPLPASVSGPIDH